LLPTAPEAVAAAAKAYRIAYSKFQDDPASSNYSIDHSALVYLMGKDGEYVTHFAYGTPPVVRRTGGLADSVHDTDAASLESGAATGFVFEQATAEAFAASVRRAITLFHDKTSWNKLQINGMERDLSWTRSAREYLKIYQSLLNQ